MIFGQLLCFRQNAAGLVEATGSQLGRAGWDRSRGLEVAVASAIGRPCVERLGAEGARVVLSDINRVAGAELKARVPGSGAQARCRDSDAGSPDQVRPGGRGERPLWQAGIRRARGEP